MSNPALTPPPQPPRPGGSEARRAWNSKSIGIVALAAIFASALGVVSSQANRIAAGITMAMLGAYTAAMLLDPPRTYPNEEGGFYPLGAMPLVMVLLLVDAIAAIAGTGPLLEWSPGIAGLPLAVALGVAEYRRLSAWRHRHDTSPE